MYIMMRSPDDAPAAAAGLKSDKIKVKNKLY